MTRVPLCYAKAGPLAPLALLPGLLVHQLGCGQLCGPEAADPRCAFPLGKSSHIYSIVLPGKAEIRVYVSVHTHTRAHVCVCVRVCV